MMAKPDPKSLFRGLDEKARPKLVIKSEVPGPAATAEDATTARQRSRQGKKVVTYYLDPEPFTQLKVLSAKTGTTVQDLNLEALNLLFEKHQISRLA
jgi:hypothetical protein